MARSRQITTKTPSPAATIIISTSFCISTEQFNCLSPLLDQRHQKPDARPGPDANFS